MTLIARAMRQVDGTIESCEREQISEAEAWRVICDAVDRARPAPTQGAVVVDDAAVERVMEAVAAEFGACSNHTAEAIIAALRGQ